MRRIVYFFKPKNTSVLVSFLFTIFIFLASVLVLQSWFITPVAASTLVSLNPVADATVKEDNPTKNYGAEDFLTSQGTDFRLAYLRFDLSSLAGKNIISAKLRIKTATVDGASKTSHDVKFVANNSWVESTITYNTSYNSADTTLKPSTLLATIGPTALYVYVDVPLTSIVSQKKGGLLSLAVVPAGTTTPSDDQLSFSSRDATADKPAIIVEYDIPPTATPTRAPTVTPTKVPTVTPTKIPTNTPTKVPTVIPTSIPTTPPSITPTRIITPAPTSSGGFGGITLGQSVSGIIYVTFYSDQSLTDFMRFYIDNKFLNEEHEYPYSLGGDTAGVVNGFDTRQLSNGQHTLRAEIHFKDGTVQLYEVTFTVNNLIQITPVCVQPIACPVNSTNPLCLPNVQPFGGWCPPVTIILSPSPTVPISVTPSSLPSITPTITVQPSLHTLSIKTERVSITADDFYFISGGKKYYPSVNAPLSAYSNPGDATHTTLEIKWPDGTAQDDFTMKLENDGLKWYAVELQTMTEQPPITTVTYQNKYFSTPLGSAFQNPGDEVLIPAGSTANQSMIYFKNLKVQAFTDWTPTPSGSACPLKPQGDANCDNKVDMIDYQIWREGFIVLTTGTVADFEKWRLDSQAKHEDPDFNLDTKLDLVDYQIWREGFIARLLP